MTNLKLYMTSLEPDIEQTIPSQSIGGYSSTSLLYPETTLSAKIGLYDTSFILDTPDAGNWLEWQGEEYINIGNEIIQVSPVVNGTISVVQRGYNGIINMHLKGDIARAVSSQELFNDVFSDNRKQYRCLALKNVSSNNDPSDQRVAYDISIYLKQNSRNDDSSVKLSLEQPISQYWLGTSASWNTIQVVDSSLIGIYNDDHFKGAYLRITSGGAIGQGKIVNSYDTATGTFTLISSFSSSYDYTADVDYEVLPSPAQRIRTGIVAPSTAGDNVFPFYSPTEGTDMSFITSGSTPIISDLNPNDIIYIWLERTIEKGSEFFAANDIVLNFKYKVS